MDHQLQHIAFILDGNRRWAEERGLPKAEGHTHGFENAKHIITACADRGISYVTMYAWSTENHKNRSEQERNHVFQLLERLKDLLHLFKERDIRFGVIGNLDPLPLTTKHTLNWLINQTKSHSKGQATMAINYGGRDEITRALQRIVTAGIAPADIKEATITAHLDTAGIPDPELMIRTGKGNTRTSNFLPWQLAYSELYFPGVYWPAFDETELDKAIEHFQTQKRNFGK